VVPDVVVPEKLKVDAPPKVTGIGRSDSVIPTELDGEAWSREAAPQLEGRIRDGDRGGDGECGIVSNSMGQFRNSPNCHQLVLGLSTRQQPPPN